MNRLIERPRALSADSSRLLEGRPRLPRPMLGLVLATALLTLLGALMLAPGAQAAASCPARAQCGSVNVPLDRGDPSAGTIDVAYALIPRTDTSRPPLSTIVTNPGGPGQTTIGSAGLYLEALAPLRKRRDLLLVDPRGTGQSGALSCPSLAVADPLTLDKARVGELCGDDLGVRAGLYGSAAVADDIEAVRAKLAIPTLDLWGDSYGTFLMPVYAARHPDHVRSIVLDGAFPIESDRWGRDVLGGVRRVIGRVCKRTQRCSAPRVLTRIERLAERLRQHPITYEAQTPIGPLSLTLDERVLADVTFGGGSPEVYGLLPAAVDAAIHGDYALMKRLATTSRVGEVGQLFIDPSVFSLAASVATECHDYPRPYDLASAPADRRADYDRGLAMLDPSQFRPFSAAAWLGAGIDAGPKCLEWPADPTAGSPLQGQRIPDVPVLVQSGGLDTATPVEQGRRAAAQFDDATFAVVANAGHTPDLHPCGVAMAIDFVRHLRTDPDRCRRAGRPPVVVKRPPVHAAQLRAPRLRHAAAPVRRAIRVAVATVADARSAASYSGASGRLDALRGGTYEVGRRSVRYKDARVVAGVVASGAGRTRGGITRTRLRLGGSAVAPSRLLLSTAGTTTRVTGTVGARHVAVDFPAVR